MIGTNHIKYLKLSSRSAEPQPGLVAEFETFRLAGAEDFLSRRRLATLSVHSICQVQYGNCHTDFNNRSYTDFNNMVLIVNGRTKYLSWCHHCGEIENIIYFSMIDYRHYQ